MEILLKNISDIVNKKLSLSQRGILITALITKDKSSKVALVKFRESIVLNDLVKCDLIFLQEKGYLKWSGYKSAKKRFWEMEHNKDVKEAIEFMNNLYGRGFKYTTEANVSDLRSRLEEYSLDDIKKVISNRYIVWKNDSYMNQYLVPTTIFRAKHFPKYLEEALRTKKGASIVEANKIDLKDGDTITFENSQNFVDQDIYKTLIYKLGSNGDRIGSGVDRSFYGKDLKMRLKLQQRLKNKDEEYVYKIE